MSGIISLEERNKLVAAMLADGNQLRNFYRFSAQNPHIELYEACQIVINRPNASVCFSFEEWNAMDRRITRGKKGIPYYDRDGNKGFVFDAQDTNGDARYQRLFYPLKRMLEGLDELNGTSLQGDGRSDYRKIHRGVQTYLREQSRLTGNETYDGLLIEGTAYSLYCKTGFPKDNGIMLNGLPYSYKENAELFKQIYMTADFLSQEIEDAFERRAQAVNVIDDTEDETTTDKVPIPVEQTEIPVGQTDTSDQPMDEPTEQVEQPKYKPYYQRYLDEQKKYPEAVVIQRLGDFYEVFGDKAEDVADELDLTLTGRTVAQDERAPMCGFPYHVAELYTEKILEKHPIVWIEASDEEARYILSHDEAMGKMPMLTEITDDEPSPFDDEEKQPDYVGDIDTHFPIKDEYENDDDDVSDASEQEDYPEDLSEEKPKSDKKKGTTSGNAKPIKDRKRKNISQLSIFDLMEEQQEQSPEEALIERQLKYGSGVEYGKYRIYDKYNENPTEHEFAEFLKEEYGWGGHSEWGGDDENHDAKGIKMSVCGENGEKLITVSLNWNQVAVRIADLIDDDNYLTEQEKKEYPKYVAEQEREKQEQEEAEKDKNAFIGKIIKRTTADRKQRILDEYAKTTELTTFAEFLSNEYGTSIESGDGYRARYDAAAVWITRYNSAGNTQDRYTLTWNDFADRVCTLIENDKYIDDEQQEIPVLDGRDLDAEEDEDWEKLIRAGKLRPTPRQSTESTLNRFKELSPEAKRIIEENQQSSNLIPRSSPWDEVQSCTTIANGIYSVSTDGHGGIMIVAGLAEKILTGEALANRTDMYNGYYCYEEDCDAAIPLRELYDKGILQKDNAYFLHSYVNLEHTGNIDDYVPFDTLTDEQKEQFFKDWNKGIDESLQRWHPRYWKAWERKENLEKTDDRIKQKIKSIVDDIVKEGTENTSEGNWIVYFDEFKDDEQFVREHKEEIADALEEREEVSDVVLDDDSFDTNFYLSYCPNYEWKDGERDEEETEKEQGNTASGEIRVGDKYIYKGDTLTVTGLQGIYPNEVVCSQKKSLDGKPYTVTQNIDRDELLKNGIKLREVVIDLSPQREAEQRKPEQTDLNKIGFEQKELGGNKTRFRNNVAAIKLVNRLYAENRDPTDEEKKILAIYVGWGGLSQVFDEKNEEWRREYAELKELLSEEDYERAKGSTLNAHYTSKEVIGGIYHALERFGIKGNNRILEPAMGTGNFFGYMPQEIADGSKLYGVELDNLTGRIATKLYPEANVQIKGFEDTTFPNDRFDVVVGNVPFGGYSVFDTDYNKYNFYIHDYFLAKSIDKLKAGGVMAVVTSKGTMDKLNPNARKYLADRAELLGAIRLPNTAFKQTAGTDVITDILFFKKRDERINANTENTEWLSTGTTEAGFEINNYFIKHPEMILGILAKEHGLYNTENITVKPDGRPLSEALIEAIEKLPQGIFDAPQESPEVEQTTEVDYNVKHLCYKAENGRLYMRIGEEMVEQAIPKYPKDAYQRIVAMIALREELHHILDIQIQGCSDEVLALEQRQLNAHYDTFVKKYGNVNSQTNTKLFKEDGDSALLFACEDIDEETKVIFKADIFTKRTIRPYTAVTSTDDCFEALQISQNERGRVDISYIEELTKKDYDTVLSELGNAVFRDPDTVVDGDKYSGFQTAEEYLSGQVVSKLQTARDYATEHPDFQKNVAALEQIQPTPLTAGEISVRLGASWVDKKYYEEFYRELIGLPWYFRHDFQLFYNPHDSSWRLDQKAHVRYTTDMKQKEVYGTKRAPAYRLFEDLLNLRATTIYDTIQDADGKEKRVINQAETIAAREKQNKIKEEFAKWIFADPERREDLERTYNSLFNRIRLPSFDGSYLRFPEMNPTIELKPHQKNAVHRIISGKVSTLLHHVVGAGKTYTMIASIMKMRQYGLCNKAMVAVPNHLVQQWAAEWRKLYPNAKLLIATKEDLEKDNRRKFVSKCAMGDWDGIIIAQSSFAKIPVSTERQIENLQKEIARIEMTVKKTWEESEMPRGAVKNLERIKKSKEAQLKKLMDSSDKDSVLNFESLGVDYLYIDEAHYYKNLFLYSKMNNVAGISAAASQRASDLKLKIEYLQEKHGSDRGVVFATGTPISNSMTEMYTMQSYLQPSVLQEAGINFFDSWAADFGETVTSLELAPSGQGYKARTRFSKFTNLPELLTMYRSFADVQTADMVKLDVPEAERIVVNLKPSDTVVDLAEEIAKRADRINGGGVDPHIDNMLKVTSDGKKLALDPRCYVDTASDEEGSKLNECAARVYEVWEQSTEKKGTQIVFCDLSTPKCRYEEYEYGKDFDAYNDLKHKLVERGIPPEEIAFIHDANTDEQKQALFDKVNGGTVRVLIGSTEKCGAGTNVQKRLVALHHLDTPYRPSDMQQREGRIIRQGNINEKVQIFTYVTERTFDSYSYQILENKQRFISQIDRGDLTVREAEDIDDRTLSYAEIKAITAANPRIKRKMEVDAEVARLRVLEGQYRKNLYALQDNIRKKFPEEIRRQELLIERVREDTAMLKEKYNPETFEISVNGKVYTDKKEGGKALTEALYASSPETVVAEYCGFKISIDPIVLIGAERTVTIAGSGQYGMNIGQSASGNLTRFENFIEDFSNRERRMTQKLEQIRQNLAIAEEEVKKPFEHEEHLAELLKEQAELNAELNLDKREEVIIEDEGGSSDGENYTVLPDRNERTQKGRPRKRLDNIATEQINKQAEQNPNVNIFYKNGDGYDLIGEQAERFAAENGLHIKTEIVDGKSYAVLPIKESELDNYVAQLVDRGEKTLVIEPIPRVKEVDFIENEDKVAEMQVEVLPDRTISQESMNDYGYKWNGMLPVRREMAKTLLNHITLYALYGNDTESEVKSENDIEVHNGIFGVEKPDWNEFINSKEGVAYLYARKVVADANGILLNREMDYFDAKFTDPLSDSNFEEKTELNEFLKGIEPPTADETKPYIMDLISEQKGRLGGVPYEAYGWTLADVKRAIARNIFDNELRIYAEEAVKIEEKKLVEEKENYEQAMKEENPKDFADEDPFTAAMLDDIEVEGNFKKKSKQGYPVLAVFDDGERKHAILRRERTNGDKDYIVARGYNDRRGEWAQGDYDFTSYQAAEDFLEQEYPHAEQIENFTGEELVYKQIVQDSVANEFADFKAKMLNKSPEEVFLNNYKIHIYTELCDTIQDGEDLTEKDFRALYEERGNVLRLLYDEFIDRDGVSVETYWDTAQFIKGYNEHFHDDIMEQPLLFNGEQTYYFGNDENGTAYYFLPALNRENLAEIKRETSRYIIVAPTCHLSKEQLDEYNIQFLKLDRDIAEEELKIPVRNIESMQVAVRRAEPLYMQTAEYALEHGEIAEYRWSMRLNQECKEELDKAIGNNFKDNILNKEFVKGFVEKYGIDRVSNIIASTITQSDWDKRYTDENKEWARTVPLTGDERSRAGLHLSAHPVLVNSVADDIRKEYEKQKSEIKEEEKEMPENQAQAQAATKPQRNWLRYKVSTDAVIRIYNRWTWMKMPQDNPEYKDYTYNVFTNRMWETVIPLDGQGDESESAWGIAIAEDEIVRLKNRDGDEKELSAKEFIALVDGSTSERYATPQSERNNIVIPREAVMKTYESTTLFAAPNGVGYDGYIYYLPNSVIKENTDTEKGDIAANIGKNFNVTLRKGDEKVQFTGEQFAELLGKTNADSYKRQPTAMDEYREQQGEDEQQTKWQTVPLNEKAVLHKYENSTLLKMPKGEYAGLVCYVPNGFIKESEKGLDLRIPEDFTAHLKGDDKVIDLDAATLVAAIKDKTNEDYETNFRKPSEEKVKAFEAVEKNLRENVPAEMKAKPNWVIVRTSENKDTGRFDKYLIDVHTGKAAKSNDASTWTDFDSACQYAKENGGVALAYALDGQDNIVCIDVDDCIDEVGNINSVGATTAGFGNGTYSERSISGKGLHVFGKMQNLDVRAFSKDGDLEFYQDKHFIAMTGNPLTSVTSKELKDLDKTGMREFISQKCEKRTEWKGVGAGIDGLSVMYDREVLDRAMSAKNGDTFKRLYNGEDIRNNHSNSDMSLMNQLAFWCRHDKDQMLRIFATSGLYRPDKPQSYYEYTAMKAVKSSPAYNPPKASNSAPKSSGGGNGKV